VVNTKDRIGKKMLGAIKELGDYVKKRERLGDIETFVDKAKLDKNTKQILCIVLQHRDEEISYRKVVVEDYDSKKAMLCLYRRGASGGIDISPSTLITKIDSTFENKITNWFKDRESNLLKIMGKEIERRRDEIKRDLIKRYEEIPKNAKRNVLLTVKLEENSKEKYIGEISEFKEIFIQETFKRYCFLKSIGESKGEGICYLCGKSGEVCGFVLPSFGFSFSTADKKGFSPNFIQDEQWKEIPICKDCVISLERGKRFLDEHLSFPKKGYNLFTPHRDRKKMRPWGYYVIPKFVFGEIFEEFYNDITYFSDKEYEKGLLSEEDYLEEIVKEKEDVLRLIFLFYRRKGGGAYIDIMYYVEDVLPSWIKELYECQYDVRREAIFREENIKKILGKEWTGDFISGRIGKEKGLGENNWFIKFTRDLFPSSETEGMYDKYFMDVVSSILSRKPIDKDFMISAFVDRIRSAYKERDGYRLKLLCLKALMLYLFVVKMNLLRGEKMGEEKTVEETEGEDLESKVKQFFEEYGFHNPAKRAAFSVGMLVDYLLWVQRSERGSGYGEEPFWSNLYGLVLDEKKIKGLFPKALSKLRQYRKGHSALETVVSKYLAEAEQDWNISNDETSYYFALGMTLRRLFSKNKEEKKEGE